MYKIASVTSLLLVILFLGCKKGGDDSETLVPRVTTAKLIITAPTNITLQKYQDTLLIPIEYKSDSSKEIDVKSTDFEGTDTDLGIIPGMPTRRTPFTDTIRIYANPGAKAVVYVRHMNVLYDADSAKHSFIINVVPNANCSFLFAGEYTFRQLYPATPGTFMSSITETGINQGMISNFANSGKSVQVTFDCAHEILNIPQQAFDANTQIRGSGTWGANGLTINYTASTSTFTTSGTVQGTR